MQASAPDLSVMPVNLNQGSVSGVTSPEKSQPIGTQGEKPGRDFAESLDSSMQALQQGEPSPPVSGAPAQQQVKVEQYLNAQPLLAGGNGLPLEDGVATTDASGDELTADLRELFDNGSSTSVLDDPSASSQGEAGTIAPLIMSPGTDEARAQLDQRRLFERFQSLPEVRQMVSDLPPGALRQALGRLGNQTSATVAAEPKQPVGWLSSNSDGVALTPVVQGDIIALQLSKMAEMKNMTMTLQDGAVLDSMVKADMPDTSTLSSTMLQRQASPALVSSDARPANPAFIAVPLRDAQWQTEFSNRVTWLARAGGNQTAEIRLNPANLGPIEVRVVMKDDQATITFTAQHGMVREAIEASLPRLREMFSGSGLQLANANVSDQSLQEQRQQHQQDSAADGGRSQGRYDQMDELGDLISPLVISHSSMLVDSVDLYA